MLNTLLKSLYPYKYLLLLLSSFLLIFSLPIPSQTSSYELIFALITSSNILAGLVVVGNVKGIRSSIIRVIGIVLITIQFLDLVIPIPAFESILASLFVIFFVSISIRVYRDIFKAKEIDLEILAAVFCGYIFLGFLASFLFMGIESVHPGSFGGMDAGITRFDNVLYFSFITLLTIGYGDMVPLTTLTKSLVVAVGLIGNFYTVMVTAIVIGKFLMNYKPGSKEND